MRNIFHAFDLFAQFALQVGEEKYDENKCYVQG